ncbi:MAG: hypothetical protein ACD_50C00309G0003 [uncultured bacterium]|nr:MAG: hypothetical protein ACD_50C00309G0003 [uncultured bacterium]OGH13172.1 MAG: hypothetical protein A2687_05305 [Candidatus Levybacteria bacterium RIFCSPHIGHO2_01_FULL_38_26]
MKVILVAVSSVNGKLTKGNETNIYTWASKEDSEIYFSLIEKHNLIVMGSKTYEAARKIIKLKADKLRIVLTRNPEKFKDDIVKGMLEFSSESPRELINRLGKQGYTKMLLVGGVEINTIFLKNSLVDELQLTIEPLIFGQGKNLVSDEELDLSLELINIKKLNKKGTIHLIYKVNK